MDDLVCIHHYWWCFLCLLLLFYFHWSTVALQCCASFYCTAKCLLSIYTCIPPFFGFPSHLLLLFNHPVVSDSFRSHGLQYVCQAFLSFTIFQSLLKLMSIESVIPSNHLIIYCPFLLPPSVFPSVRVFSKESVLCIRWPEYWSFSFSINPSNEH